MTVCIAAACEHGKWIVTATDGLLSLGDVAGECVVGKMRWEGEWQFMYAGNPANFAMVGEEVTRACLCDPEAFSRLRVQETVRNAYVSVRSRIASFGVLSPFNLTMEQFRADGLNVFGERSHEEIVRRISEEGSRCEDQIIVTGWGSSPFSSMVYEIGPMGEWLHDEGGFCAIGSGAAMAQTMLLLMGQSRTRTLAETIFNVACAKFSSEKSVGFDVGKATLMNVSWKRTSHDHPGRLCNEFVYYPEIDKLRELWEAHLKPRIPDEARGDISDIAARFTRGRTSPRDMIEEIKAEERLGQKHSAASPRDSPNPQSTTTDPAS